MTAEREVGRSRGEVREAGGQRLSPQDAQMGPRVVKAQMLSQAKPFCSGNFQVYQKGRAEYTEALYLCPLFCHLALIIALILLILFYLQFSFSGLF